MRLARVALLAALAVVAVSCGEPATDIEAVGPADTTAPSENPASTTTTRPGATTTTTTNAQGGSLKWKSCGPRVECAKLQVPLVHTEPGGEKITLALKRRPTKASSRIGSLLVNPGGPGVPGTSLVDQASLAFSDDLMQHFDIVSWDPRGTGDSVPVDCVDDLDPYFSSDPTPDDAAEKQILIDEAREFAAACAARTKDVLAHISTQDTAKDMDLVRAALGEEETTYFGFSYGSELGATYATLFPKRVRAMVLDGAADPNAGYEADVRATVVGLDSSLNALLDDCADHKRCAFNNDGRSQKAYDELMASLDVNPLLVDDNRPPVGQGIAYYAVVSALYDESYWPVLTSALASAQAGDGSGLLAMYDDYVQRNPDGTFSNAFEALIAINCLDDPGPQDMAFPEQFAAELKVVSPRFGEWGAYSYTCIDWPAPAVTPIHLDAKGADPIVVVGTTGDPVTPLESSRALAEALDQGVLVTVEAERHTGYGVNGCIVRTVDDYLIDLVVPPAGVVCK